MMKMSEILKNIYYNASNPASYGTARNLYNAAKTSIPGLTIEQVNDWLSGELTYTLHRPIRKNFKREKILVNHPNEQFQADLVDMQEFSKQNNGFKYILTIIDCFSRYAFAVPVKNKTGMEIRNALSNVFAVRKASILQTDRGKEFLNKNVQDFLRDNEIEFFTTHNTTYKCAIVERFNRTLKAKMYKYFTAKGTRKYIDVLDDLLIGYNKSYHRTIKARPIDVNEDNYKRIFYNIYGVSTERDYLLSQKSKPKLIVGDKVRKKYELKPMDKSFYPNWSDVIYDVSKTIKGKYKPMYGLTTFDGIKLPYKVYPEEVQKVKDNLYRIEKIIQRKTLKGKKGFIVKWLGYSSEHNSWVPEEDIVRLQNA